MTMAPSRNYLTMKEVEKKFLMENTNEQNVAFCAFQCTNDDGGLFICRFRVVQLCAQLDNSFQKPHN